MWKASLGFFMAAALGLAQQSGPALLPGEGLAIASTVDGSCHAWGEASKEGPMGSLAKLAWLRLEGDEWELREVRFTCTGTWKGHRCWKPEGHGKKLTLGKALDQSCNLAFLAWIQDSSARWQQLLGDGAARARLEEAFAPFLGRRMPPGEGLPDFGPAWIGDGELLQTSPEAFARWLADPAQDDLISRWRRLSFGFTWGKNTRGRWCMKSGTAPVPGDASASSAWVAGTDGDVVVVLHLPRGKGRSDGFARFREIMGIREP